MDVLKKLLLYGLVLSLILWGINAHAFPELTGQVVDNAGILTSAQEQYLTQLLQRANPNQVVAVSLNSLDGKEIEEYGVALGRHWGIGREDINDGVLVLIAPNHRQMRIEVGYGLEGELTDAKCSRIINRIMIPLAKEGKYDEALIQGSEAVIKMLAGEEFPEQSSQTSANSDLIKFIGLFIFFALLPIIGLILCIFTRKIVFFGLFLLPFIIIGLFMLTKDITFAIIWLSVVSIFVCTYIHALFIQALQKRNSDLDSKIKTSKKDLYKIMAKAKKPATALEENLSRKDKIKFFILMFFFLLIFGGVGIAACTMDGTEGKIFTLILFISIGRPFWKSYKKNPYYPYYEYNKRTRTSGGSSSHSGEWSSSHSSGSSFHGGGGSFGGGGSSGRW